MSNVLKNAKGITILILVGIALYIGGAAWKQTCLGIFEDKDMCEFARQYRTDFRNCAELSWKKCDSVRSDNGSSPVYEKCLDNIRCACMRRSGHSSCHAL